MASKHAPKHALKPDSPPHEGRSASQRPLVQVRGLVPLISPLVQVKVAVVPSVLASSLKVATAFGTAELISQHVAEREKA